ncbi:hypothetical protein K6119_13430 [Paracrocinitomix mangrovi]|uniref:hypothetical protein n=1 Tax=Paracrocinitomix mangrovi TaxID=2862509 RepID=UPI001C8D55F5|nr:hypothetical protein [Paracrocinitomix mangrovi]UKN00733.1 hypothetical protein K6119_13430 [Paracrocinitomix mangrovi]
MIISLSVIILGIISFYSYRYLTLPDKVQIQKDWRYTIPEAASQVNYISEIQKDEEYNRNFLKGNTSYAICYNWCFPYDRTRINASETETLVEILNDSSSYVWGEFGTPEYKYCIVFYNDEDNEIGYTEVEPMGEVDSYPYISLMKWGRMKPSSFNQLMTIIENES